MSLENVEYTVMSIYCCDYFICNTSVMLFSISDPDIYVFYNCFSIGRLKCIPNKSITYTQSRADVLWLSLSVLSA